MSRWQLPPGSWGRASPARSDNSPHRARCSDAAPAAQPLRARREQRWSSCASSECELTSHITRQGETVRRYIEIYSIMLRNSLIRSMSFKVNFLLWMVVEVLWFVGQIVFFSIIFANVDHIGDWSKWEVVLLVGTHQIIGQIFQAFFFVNIANIPELVRTGKLDSVLVLPLDSQFAVSSKQFELDSIVNAIVGAAVVIISLSNLHLVPTAVSVLLYLIALIFGVVVHYSIMLSLAAVSFWIVRAQ